MSNIFNIVTKEYDDGWNVIERRLFDDEEKACFKSCKIVPSEYGYSACFIMQNNRKRYIPLSRDSREVTVGETVDFNTAEILVLERNGEILPRLEIK